MSTMELDRLGDRLRDASLPSEADLRQVESIRPHDLAALRSVRHVLAADLGLPVTEREKNRDTIIEKLRRAPDMRLSRMQDVVGARVLSKMTASARPTSCRAPGRSRGGRGPRWRLRWRHGPVRSVRQQPRVDSEGDA